MQKDLLERYQCRMEAVITRYEGANPICRNRHVFSNSENKSTVEIEQSKWKVFSSFEELEAGDEIPKGKISTLKGRISFELTQGELDNANVAINFAFNGWSKDNYVLMPAAAYNGNRFRSLKLKYPPMLGKEHGISIDMPVTITDIPRLNIGEGKSEIQLRTGDMATPAIGFHAPDMNMGFFLQTHHNTSLGYSGIAISENESRTEATITLSAPAVREQTKYIHNENEEPSDDLGFDFREGDEAVLEFTLYFFESKDISQLFEYFASIRKDYSGNTRPRHGLPFSKAMGIVEEKYNRENWDQKYGYYKIGVSDNVFNCWQAGWVGGGMNSYPLLMDGNGLSRERSLKTLEYIFSRVQAPSGFFYTIGYQGRFYGDSFNNMEDRNFILLRKNSDMLYFLIKQLMLLEKQCTENDFQESWKQGLKKACDALVRLWKRYGQFGQFIDLETEEIVIGGTAGAGITPAALALAYQYFGNDEYLKAACESAEYYYENYVLHGITNGGPGEICQCPDSESAFGLLETYVVLYEVTEDRKWLPLAEDTARQCTTWCVSYDFQFPEESVFGKLGMCTTGSVYANVQNKHSAPGICTLSGDSLFKLYRATGNKFYLELIREISHNITQYLSREDRLIMTWDDKYLPSGYMSERVNMCDWEGKSNIGGVFYGSCWCEVSCMLTYAEVPGVYVHKDTGFVFAFDHIDVEVVENTSQHLKIRFKNPTAFDAKVKLFVETSGDTSRIMGQNALEGCDEVEVKSSETKDLLLHK